MIETQFAVLPTVHSMGVMLFDPCWAEQAHVSLSCELLHVLSGEVTLHLGGRSFTAGPGDVLLVPTATEHQDVFDLDAGLQVFMVHFNWAADESYFQQVTNDALRKLPAYCKADISMQIERMRYDTHGDSEVDRLVVRSRLLTILTLILREAKSHEAHHEEQAARGRRRRALMLAAKQYLDTHYAQPVTLDDIAQALDVNAFHLSHIFSEENDFSLFAYLTTVRLERAYELLREGTMTVSEVAQTVGYENGNYFSKVFRKYFGHSPSGVKRE